MAAATATSATTIRGEASALAPLLRAPLGVPLPLGVGVGVAPEGVGEEDGVPDSALFARIADATSWGTIIEPLASVPKLTDPFAESTSGFVARNAWEYMTFSAI